MKHILLFFGILLLFETSFPQDSLSIDNRSSNEVNCTRASIAIGALISSDVALWLYTKQAWYSNPTTKWHTLNDWYNAKLNIDKLGHAHITSGYNKILFYTGQWINLSESEANWSAAAISWLLQFQIELYDAYFIHWGFSWPDLASNTFGAVYPSLQREYPTLRNFNLKYSFFPSSDLKNGFVDDFINDYKGTTYWFTIHFHDYLPETIKKYYPDWLGIAIGYGGENIYKNDGSYNHDSNNNKRGLGAEEWYISFDYDLIKLFKPNKNSFWYGFLDFLNLIHFPAPAIRIKPSTIFYGVYF